MKKLFAFLAAALLAAPLAATAQQSVEYTELKPPQPVETKGKIEVIEFFWYGCIHCYDYEPYIEAWEKKLPKDVEFKRIPAVLSQGWVRDAEVFYAFEALGVLNKLHRPLFDAIHKDRLRTNDPQAMGEWLQNHGVDPKKFNDTLKSFGVQSKTRRAVQLTLDYKVEGTPAIVVNGRYTVALQPTPQATLQAVDKVVAMERKKK